MARAFRYGAGRSVFQALAALALVCVAVFFALRTYDPTTEIAAWSAATLGLLSFAVQLRQAFDTRPAVEIRAEGVYAQRLGGLVQWDELDALWIRRTPRKFFLVIPANSAELVLQIKPKAGFWRRRGLYRRFLRFTARFSGHWELSISLNGLRRRALKRLEETLRAAQPDLVLPTEVRASERDRKRKRGAP